MDFTADLMQFERESMNCKAGQKKLSIIKFKKQKDYKYGRKKIQ